MKQAYFIKLNKNQQLPISVPQISLDDIETIDSNKIAFWLIDMGDAKQGWKILNFIRKNLYASVYLKPVIFIIPVTDISNEIKLSSDGYITTESLNNNAIEEWISKVEPINYWIDRLNHKEATADTNTAFKVLRIMASRNLELKPIMTVKRISGYIYPILEPLFSKKDNGVMETLSFLEKQFLLSKKFLTRAHFCSHCGSAFLNFKETCPHCSSDDLDVDELVHHFKCAYTAELSEFKQSESLICPKCESKLRHIGVDYDKPSIIFHCNQCNHSFQDSVVMTDCYSCGRSSEPTTQDVQQIYTYSISAIGQNAAYYGLDTLFTNLLETELHLYSANAFRDFFQVEVARISRFKISSSSLAMINFKDLIELYIELGDKARHIFGELASIFKAQFRQSDVITAHNESIFYVLMTETNYKNAQIAIGRLEDSIKLLFENNLNTQLQIDSLIKEINSELELESTLEDFLAKTK